MSTRTLSAVLSFSLSLLAVGCGDDPEKAQDKCESFVTTYCDRIVDCAQQEDILNDPSFTAKDFRDECETYMRRNASCEDAVRVSKTFNQCVDESSRVSCDDIITALQNADDQADRYTYTLPSSCEGSVLYTD